MGCTEHSLTASVMRSCQLGCLRLERRERRSISKAVHTTVKIEKMVQLSLLQMSVNKVQACHAAKSTQRAVRASAILLASLALPLSRLKGAAAVLYLESYLRGDSPNHELQRQKFNYSWASLNTFFFTTLNMHLEIVKNTLLFTV